MQAILPCRTEAPGQYKTTNACIILYIKNNFVDTTHFPMVHKQYPFRGRGIYLITGRVDIEYDFCSITVSWMEKLATVGRDDLSKT
jgi:DNA polymerase-3 subunit alpha